MQVEEAVLTGRLAKRDGAAGTEVYVVSADGELLSPMEAALKKGRNPLGDDADGAFVTGSRQIGQEVKAVKWVDPRIRFDDLLLYYDINPWHRRSVVVKALLTGGLGWQLVRGEEVVYDPSKDKTVPSDPAAELVARPNPDPLQTFDQLVYRYLIDFHSLGNGWLEVARNRLGVPAELFHAPARTMRRDVRLNGHWQVKNGRDRKFGQYGDKLFGRNEMLHLYNYDPHNDYYGMPDWFAALAAMGLDRTILEFNTRLFQNGLMAHFAVIVTGGKLSETGRTAIQNFIRDQMQGVENAGRILLIEDEDDRVKIEIKPLNMEIKNLIIKDVQDHFRDVVIGSHGMPPRLLGVVTPGQLGATGEVEGQLRVFRETVLRPGKRALETVLNVVLDELSPGVRIRFVEMDVTNVRDDADFFDKMIGHGVYGPDEVRELLDAGLA